MLGLMQDRPLLVSGLMEHAARTNGGEEIVTVTVAEGVHRYTYGECAARCRKLASALERWGMKGGDRIATLAWNGYRHLELWYGVAGAGAVVHTINPRLFKEQIIYIANHAEDRLIFADLSFAALLEEIWSELTTLEAVVFLCDQAHMPKTNLPKALCYETFLAAGGDDYVWPTFDERTAAGLCYTSGTTGHPKGVLYTHRSSVLHAYASALPDAFDACTRDVMLPVVPMFHANAWGMPHAAPLVGAKLVMPGPHLDGKSLQKLIVDEGVTLTAGVPTVWLGLLAHLQATGTKLGALRQAIIGGSAAPVSMIEAFERDYGVRVVHAWGMTEMNPLGTVNGPTRDTARLTGDARWAMEAKQGRAIFGIEMKITDDDGRELPRDGKASGHLLVRGPWVVERYFKADQPAVDAEGWFDTGDIATLDAQGYMQITDRAKDIIKSGGEWISSIDLENAAVAHPKVAEAAVIALPHPKWTERPLLVVVPVAGERPGKDEIMRFLETQVAKWWLPDDIAFVDEIPHTATGKIQKVTLRERFKDYKLPTA